MSGKRATLREVHMLESVTDAHFVLLGQARSFPITRDTCVCVLSFKLLMMDAGWHLLTNTTRGRLAGTGGCSH